MTLKPLHLEGLIILNESIDRWNNAKSFQNENCWSGAEPDECFYIDNIEAVRGKKRLDLNEDPAPDLVIEIDVTSSSQNRLQVYADLGVAEVWVYNGESLVIQQLQNGTYITFPTSRFFPNLPILEIAMFLQQSETLD